MPYQALRDNRTSILISNAHVATWRETDENRTIDVDEAQIQI